MEEHLLPQVCLLPRLPAGAIPSLLTEVEHAYLEGDVASSSCTDSLHDHGLEACPEFSQGLV